MITLFQFLVNERKSHMTRFIALLLLAIPGIIAGIGVKLMRDTLFNYVNAPFSFLWEQLLIGTLFFIFGVTFIGGWIFYRDRKRHYVAKRFDRNPQEKNIKNNNN